MTQKLLECWGINLPKNDGGIVSTKRQIRIKKDKSRALQDKIQLKRARKEAAAQERLANKEIRFTLAKLDKIGEDDG